MANREREERGDWARRIPRRRFRPVYEDYGWEPGESVLPEFRDPSVHDMPYEQARESGESASWYEPDYRRHYEFDYGRSAYRGEYDLGNEAVGFGYAGGGYPERREDWNVPGPYAGVGPKGYQRSSDRIKEEVSERLSQHGQIDASDIEISVENGEVTFEGTVTSRNQKRLAEDVAEVTMGVIDVHNRLRVMQSQQGGGSTEQRPPQGRSGKRMTTG